MFPLFTTRCLHVRHYVRDPSCGSGNCGRECCPGNFAEMTTSTPFRDLLHAANLRHGTDGFTSPPKEGVLRFFFALKNPTASAGFEPANLGTKGQHATPRPPKPLNFDIGHNFKTLEFLKLEPGIRLTARSEWNVSWHTFAVWSFRNRFEFDGELAVATMLIGMQTQFEWQRSYCSITLRDTVCPVTPLSCVYLLFGWGL